ncbi:peptidase C39 [Chromobacterium violaceum]|uniref:C39 family peptidase n=1 Tax=Chromobacterium violaceum TaxID=536 RepID=UPI000C126765|nr:C39 family peptidase [Chromobacterium violaceum]ATP27486.1 peptidase C39 [Chromobacterium violaceum]ATP31403.1 peptidase C39 [Chromobacterium violaceum]
MKLPIRPLLSILLCLFCSGGQGGAQAADMMLPAYTGEGNVYKQVHSLRELRFRYVVEQKTDFSCGAAALTTLLRYGFGLDANEQQVIAGMMAGANPDVVRQQGFSMLDMKRFVNVLGLRASGFVSGAERLPALRIPALIMLDINGYKHFVVLKMATRDTVYVADPALGNRAIPMPEFTRQWNGVLLAVAGPGYRPQGPLRQFPSPLSARQLMVNMQPASPAELVEYGFLYSDFL